MKWIMTEKQYNDFLKDALIASPDCEVDYESFIQSILTDLHMVNIPRSRGFTEKDFVLFSHLVFPEDSEAFKWTRKIIGLKYYAKDKNEFIACFRRSESESNMIYRQRAEVEYDPEYVQFVSMAIPFFYDKDGIPIFLFIHENKTDMKGCTTMIGGHVQYNGEQTDPSSFDSVAINTAKREMVEELGLNEKYFRYTPSLFGSWLHNSEGSPIGRFRFDTRNNVPKYSISYYHIGFGYVFEISNYENAIKNIRMEDGKELLLYCPDKNHTPEKIFDYRNKEIPVLNINTFNRSKLNPEPWLMSLLDSMI